MGSNDNRFGDKHSYSLKEKYKILSYVFRVYVCDDCGKNKYD